ncbi:hypothetical protein JCM2421_02210 [Staphylococcus auricularis]|nr:hypothetical protein JCM2421_02210 [Staphylococcus auricularis]
MSRSASLKMRVHLHYEYNEYVQNKLSSLYFAYEDKRYAIAF